MVEQEELGGTCPWERGGRCWVCNLRSTRSHSLLYGGGERVKDRGRCSLSHSFSLLVASWSCPCFSLSVKRCDSINWCFQTRMEKVPRKFYHNWTDKFCFTTAERKLQVHCSEFHEWLIQVSKHQKNWDWPYWLVREPQNFQNCQAFLVKNLVFFFLYSRR